jgi:predicted ArsR family transcriptional regulator
VAEAGGPVGIDAICEATGLHPNTVRPHLDVLLAAGRIARERGHSVGRGRPPWQYLAVETEDMKQRRKLAEALLDQLHGAESADIADGAARRWAAQLMPEHRPAPAPDPDAAVDAAGDAMASLGFEVSITPTRDRMDLRGCPYVDLVAERPQICDIHAALLQQLLQAGGQPIELDRLDVYPRPGVCTAHLRRSDQRPIRTITMRSPE